MVLLNEYNQDSCIVADSILKITYHFTEEYQSHRNCGDIFYSKREMINSGHVYNPKRGTGIQPIRASLITVYDTIQIIGVHLARNYSKSVICENDKKTVQSIYEIYRESQVSRCNQTQWIKNAVLKSNHPVIVMGDMNDFNCSAPLDTFASCGMKDAWWEGGFGYGATFHDGWMRLRIDHILHSKELKLESIKVIETDLSDHNPVVAGFSINAN